MFKSILVILLSFALGFSQEAAKEFHFEQISLGMSSERVIKLYPQAVKAPQSKENLKTNEVPYVIENLKTASAVMCFFLDDNLYSVIIIYSSDLVTSIGGAGNLYKKLADRIGKNTTYHASTEEEKAGQSLQVLENFEWTYPDTVDRYFSMKVMADNSAAVGYSIPSKQQIIKSRLAAKVDYRESYILLDKVLSNFGSSVYKACKNNNMEISKIDIGLVSKDQPAEIIKFMTTDYEYLINCCGDASRIKCLSIKVFNIPLDGQSILVAEENEVKSFATATIKHPTSGKYLIEINVCDMVKGYEQAAGYFCLSVAHN